MLRSVQQLKTASRSPKSLKELVQTSDSDGTVRYNKDLLPSPPGMSFGSLKMMVLTLCRGQEMAMATLLCLLPDDDVQSKQLQPRSLARVHRLALVAWNDSCCHWIWNPDRPSRSQQPWRHQVLRRFPGLCSCRRRCQRLFVVHPRQSSCCDHLFRHTNILRRTNHDRVHAWDIW